MELTGTTMPFANVMWSAPQSVNEYQDLKCSECRK